MTIKILLSFVLSETREVRKGMVLSSNVELNADIVAKSFALSDKDEITTWLIIYSRTDALPRFRIWLKILQNSREPS